MENNKILAELKGNNMFPENLKKSLFTNWESLGEGSFGKVFKVEYKGNYFAIKVLSKSQLFAYKMIEQMKNEIKIMLKLNHKNIINLYYYFEDSRYIYLIMDFAEQGHLYKKLNKDISFNEEKCLFYIKQLLEALNYLHSLDPPIIHRDIKPENLLLKNNELKLADFGWSNFNNEIRKTFCGTIEYLSPEMLKRKDQNEKLDIWSVGILAYELFYGKSPFIPNNFPKNCDFNTKQKIIEDNILTKSINFSQKIISDEFRNLIELMLQKNESYRPSAKKLLNLNIFNINNKIIVNKRIENYKNHSKNKDKNYEKFNKSPNHKIKYLNYNSQNKSNDDTINKLNLNIKKLEIENNNYILENEKLKKDLKINYEELKNIEKYKKKENDNILKELIKIKNKYKEKEYFIKEYENKLNKINLTTEKIYNLIKRENKNFEIFDNTNNNILNKDLLENIYKFLSEKKNKYIEKYNLYNMNKEEIIDYFHKKINYYKNEINNLKNNLLLTKQ